MRIGRRDFTQLSGAAVFATLAPGCATPPGGLEDVRTDRQGHLRPGQARGVHRRSCSKAWAAMPGCLSYVVARDPKDPDAIWITEVWDSKESHAASLQLPAVREATSSAAGR